MKKLLALLLLLSVIFKPNYNVQAEEVRITYNKLKGIAYNQKIDGKLKSNTVTMFQMGDRIAYCVEPGVEITDNYYDIYTDWSKVNFSDEAIEYLVQKASDELFTIVVDYSSFSTDDWPDSFYQRLFEPRHLDLLKKYLQACALPGKFEVRLLESGDKELIDLYFENGDIVISLDAKIWLLKHPQSEYADDLLGKVDDLGYFGEARLFKSGDSEKIQHYLS